MRVRAVNWCNPPSGLVLTLRPTMLRFGAESWIPRIKQRGPGVGQTVG